ncbi:MAG: hypothetical protein GWP69_08235 [Gammaproteobacteria bacterium]|jgi:hypothetical protein|nr:hypothetical protein [Gammaproteobacteria bacterium]
MPVIGLEVIRSEMFADGTSFGDVGAYRRIEGIARYAVDPEHAANAGITDLELAERTADGRVLFDGDISMLVPADLARASGALMVEVPNRGNRIAPRSFNQAPFDLTPTDEINMGDGFLMRQGWCIAWVGWQWDMPAYIERLGLRAPQVPPGQRGTATHMHLRIQPDQLTDSYTLTDHHVGAIGNHAPIPPIDADDPQAQLLVRQHLRDEGNRIDRDRWRFATDDNGNFERVTLDGGFEPGRIYDLLYTPRDCPVAGAGLLAVRDFASFARHDATSPIAGAVTHTIGQGISQCGRFLRTLMFLGLNVDECGRQVFDGILAHIAGGRRGEFNQRYGQPSVQPTPSFGHLFPFADEPQTNPQTGERAGLLDKLRERGVMPKVMYTDTSSEYWRGDAGLTHTRLADNCDADLPGDVRRYLFASTQHGPGLLPYADRSIFGSHGSNVFNAVDYRPLFRAALENLRRWIMDDIPPPDSVFPRRDDGTGMTRAEVVDRLAGIDGLSLPKLDRLPSICPLELGPGSVDGIGSFPARLTGQNYPTVVAAVDSAGNEIGGVRMPDVEVPVATHTGFNPRHMDSGGAGQILEYVGSTLPLADLEQRYTNKDDYLQRVRAAAQELIDGRLVLEEDMELCIAIASQRYDAALAEVRGTNS